MTKIVSKKPQSLWLGVARRRTSFAWLTAAAVVMFAAFACTTIQTRDSIFYATQLRILVAALSSVAASQVLLAANMRGERWHVASWITVTAAWFLILNLT